MAKAKTTTESKTVVYHAKHLTAKQKSSGVSYTYDWNKVTDPAHLELRNKALLEAQENKAEALEAEQNEATSESSVA